MRFATVILLASTLLLGGCAGTPQISPEMTGQDTDQEESSTTTAAIEYPTEDGAGTSTTQLPVSKAKPAVSVPPVRVQVNQPESDDSTDEVVEDLSQQIDDIEGPPVSVVPSEVENRQVSPEVVWEKKTEVVPVEVNDSVPTDIVAEVMKLMDEEKETAAAETHGQEQDTTASVRGNLIDENFLRVLDKISRINRPKKPSAQDILDTYAEAGVELTDPSAIIWALVGDPSYGSRPSYDVTSEFDKLRTQWELEKVNSSLNSIENDLWNLNQNVRRNSVTDFTDELYLDRVNSLRSFDTSF